MIRNWGGNGREIVDLWRVTALSDRRGTALVGDTIEKAARWTVDVQSTGRLQTPQRSDRIS